MTLKIVADAAIPFANTFFSAVGEVTLINGRDITPAAVRNADVLVTRTVTPVNESLLRDSPVRFVASVTSGLDHVDGEYLESRHIGFAYAPGCNARSVAEYVLSSLCVLSDQAGFDLLDKRVGIIGCGQTGSMVRALLQALGMECLIHDPPLEERGGAGPFCNLEDILAADILTLHVPLTDGGNHPTRGMFSEALMNRLKDDIILINTSRGGVADERALLDLLRRHPRAAAVVDVWANEPDITLELVRKAAIATPHIAGYSTDGKLKGARMVYERICDYFDIKREEILPPLPQAGTGTITLSGPETIQDAIRMAVLSSYDVRSDSIALRRILDIDAGERRLYFDELRNHYPLRREFPAMNIELINDISGMEKKLTALGFKVTAR